jgi:hypothetical protein
LDLLGEPVNGDASLILEDQLIAALLNQNVSCGAPEGVTTTIGDAQDWMT